MGHRSKNFTAKRNFILQQGLDEPPGERCSDQFSALQFQPRIVASLVVLGTILQSPAIFLFLSVLLWWSALVPEWNPFDIFHNLAFGGEPGSVQLEPAPAPRRFAQGMAATFALAIGTLLLFQWKWAALFFEVLFLAAVAALVFGRFCLGSFVFHLIHGRVSFAKRTLPWVQKEKTDTNSCGRA